jgi:hypothetical protein
MKTKNKEQKHELPTETVVTYGRLLYAVFRVDSKMTVMGMEIPLPKGEYVIPVFEDYEKAVEYSQNGKFQIQTLSAGSNGI